MITLNQICFAYHKKEILKEVSLHVKKGSCICLVGDNGCGKSTLFSIIAGIRKPSSGTILLHGEDVASNKHLFQEIGYVPQENPLIPDLTVKDNLALWYAGTPYSCNKDRKDGILSMLHLDEFYKMPVHKLSGGMKKRVSFAVALSRHPDILLLDEPGTSLDLTCKKEIRTYLEAFKQSGGTILFTTHDEADFSLSDQIYAFENKKLVEVK